MKTVKFPFLRAAKRFSDLWLANCCFADIFLGFSFLLRFCDEQSGYFLATLARLLGPGGVRSIVAESLILKHNSCSWFARGNDRRTYAPPTASSPA
jgi:hypothetical protein